VGFFAVGLPLGALERSADHQFPFREPPIFGRPLSDPGVAFLRVHGDQIAEAEAKVHKGRRRLVLLRRLWRPMPEGGEAFTC